MLSVNLADGQTLNYIDEATVAENIKSRGFAEDKATTNLERSDLTTHVYEGGFKVWECSIDLCDLLKKHGSDVSGKRVIELGCGAALPGIVCAQLGASRVVLQDFNECVLRCFTADNIEANGLGGQRDTFELIDGGWTELEGKVEKNSFDLVLTSETIYNESDYAALHDAIVNSLSPDGLCLLAAKFFYFGVGGCVPTFVQYVESRGQLNVVERVAIDAGIPRRILELRHRK